MKKGGGGERDKWERMYYFSSLSDSFPWKRFLT